MQPVLAAIAVGSNMGDRVAHVARAWAGLARIERTRLLRCSSIIETPPWGPVAQGPYLNAACVVETSLTGRELLTVLQEIERVNGRDRGSVARFGPRTLDLDLILFGDAVLNEDQLTVPHPRMHERAFVLEPLAQIAPEMVHPSLAMRVDELRDRVRAGC